MLTKYILLLLALFYFFLFLWNASFTIVVSHFTDKNAEYMPTIWGIKGEQHVALLSPNPMVFSVEGVPYALHLLPAKKST